MTLFRPEVIEARRRRLWGDVKLSQPPSFLIWTIVLTTVSAVLVMGLVFGSYVKKETVRGYLVPEGGIVNVASSNGGRITRVHVHEGDHVALGAPLIEFSGESIGANTGKVLEGQIAQLDEEIRNAKLKQQASKTTVASNAQRLTDQIATNNTYRATLVKRLDDKRQAIDLLKDELGRLENLAAQGYAPQLQVNEKKQQILSQQDDLNNLGSQLATLDGTIVDLKSQLTAVPAFRSTMLADVDTQLANLEERRIELSAKQDSIERAPVTGVISNLQGEVGQTPLSDEPLVSIMPDASALQAELLLPTSAAGFLKVGDEARLQIDAYPFERYGFVTGRVLSISKSVVSPREYLTPIEFKEAAYRVHVVLDRDYVVAYGQNKPLRPGMALTADIIIDKKPLWRRVFDPLLAARSRNR